MRKSSLSIALALTISILSTSLWADTSLFQADHALAYYRLPNSTPEPAPSTPPLSLPSAPNSETQPTPSNPVSPTSLTPLTLEQALEQAALNNPGIVAMKAQLGISDAAIVTAKTPLNPSVISDNGIAEKTYRLGIQQTFQLGGKRGRRVALAKTQRDVIESQVKAAVLDLRSNLRKAYTRFYIAQQRLSAYEEMVQTNEHLVTITSKREKAGDVPSLDVLQAELSAVRVSNNAQTAFAEMIQARNNFNILLGQPFARSWLLENPQKSPHAQQTTAPSPGVALKGGVGLTDSDLEALVQEGLAQRPELQQNRLEILASDQQLALARANRVPDFNLAVGPDWVLGSEGQLSAFVVGSFELPLVNRQQGPILSAKATKIQLQSQKNVLTNQITLDIVNAYTTFSLNQGRLERYETVLMPKAKRVVDLSQRSFQEGKANILIPLNAQQAYMETHLEYLQAVTDYQNALSDLERAVGTPL